MDVIEINLIFLKLASDYDLSQSEFMSSRIQFPPWCDMPLSVGNYSVASNNESCHREQKRIVFDGDHLVTTETPTSTRQEKKKKKERLKVPKLCTAAFKRQKIVYSALQSVADQCVITSIQLLVIRALECISV